MLTSTGTIIGQIMGDPAVHGAIVNAVVAVLGAALTAVATLAGMLIKTKLHAENSTWKQNLAYRLVCYAENKVLGNAEKQQYVADQLHQKFPSIDPEEVKHLIEEAVIKLQTTQSGAPAPQTLAESPPQGAQ